LARVFHLINLTNVKTDLANRKIYITVEDRSLSACLKTLRQTPGNQANSSSAEQENLPHSITPESTEPVR